MASYLTINLSAITRSDWGTLHQNSEDVSVYRARNRHTSVGKIWISSYAEPLCYENCANKTETSAGCYPLENDLLERQDLTGITPDPCTSFKSPALLWFDSHS
jgi:hypothetical protein